MTCNRLSIHFFSVVRENLIVYTSSVTCSCKHISHLISCGNVCCVIRRPLFVRSALCFALLRLSSFGSDTQRPYMVSFNLVQGCKVLHTDMPSSIEMSKSNVTDRSVTKYATGDLYSKQQISLGHVHVIYLILLTF